MSDVDLSDDGLNRLAVETFRVATKPKHLDWTDLLIRVRNAALARGRAEENEACKRDVCMYCAGRAPGWEPAKGPNEATNWTHSKPNQTWPGAPLEVLCLASSIFAREWGCARLKEAHPQGPLLGFPVVYRGADRANAGVDLTVHIPAFLLKPRFASPAPPGQEIARGAGGKVSWPDSRFLRPLRRPRPRPRSGEKDAR